MSERFCKNDVVVQLVPVRHVEAQVEVLAGQHRESQAGPGCWLEPAESKVRDLIGNLSYAGECDPAQAFVDWKAILCLCADKFFVTVPAGVVSPHHGVTAKHSKVAVRDFPKRHNT